MEDGRLNNLRVGYIIQARMASTRLPGKILMPLPFDDGKPLIKWITDALKKSRYDSSTVIATSVNPENEPLNDFCKAEQIRIFRGDEENVLSRFIAIVAESNFDVVVRLTADNPIIDLALLEYVIEQHIRLNKEYTKTEGLPLGMNFEVINPKVLLALKEEELSKEDCEHVTLYIRNHSSNTHVLAIGDAEFRDLRLTIDYPSDYAAVSFFLTSLKNGESPTYEMLQQVARTKRWIFDINGANGQKGQYISENEERAEALKLLRASGFNMTAQRLAEMASN